MPNIQEIIKIIASKRKTSFPWQRQQPYPQPYFTYDTSTKSWQESYDAQKASTTHVSSFRVLSWNIDFMLPYPNERMQVALDHLRDMITSSQEPSIIFLNEMLESDLQLIQTQDWVREGYAMTDISHECWESGHYGTCTLVPKALPVAKVFRVHYEATNMERDGLFVELDVGQGRVISVCNSHLESLVADPPLRPAQVETAAKYLQASHLTGGLMAGDFNAIQPFDRTLHSENGLRDAYLELGGKEDTDDGYTWGQMAPVKQREMFGCSRMDKVFFCGGLKVLDFERFGHGVDVKDGSVKKELVEVEGMDGGWVTDHLGVMATFRIEDAIKVAPKI